MQALLDEMDFNIEVASHPAAGELGCELADHQFRRAIQTGALALLDETLKRSVNRAYVDVGKANHFLLSTRSHQVHGNAYNTALNSAQETIKDALPLLQEAKALLLQFLGHLQTARPSVEESRSRLGTSGLRSLNREQRPDGAYVLYPSCRTAVILVTRESVEQNTGSTQMGDGESLIALLDTAEHTGFVQLAQLLGEGRFESLKLRIPRMKKRDRDVCIGVHEMTMRWWDHLDHKLNALPCQPLHEAVKRSFRG